jgi:hypothetical protein
MNILVPSLAILITLATVSAPAEESLERLIADAASGSHAISTHRAELAALQLQQKSSTKADHALTPSQSARLKELEAEFQSALSANRKVIGKIKTGDLVFSYPGLLAIAPVFYNAYNRTYLFQIQEGFSMVEGVKDRQPDFFVITFDSTGRITETHRYRTADDHAK